MAPHNDLKIQVYKGNLKICSKINVTWQFNNFNVQYINTPTQHILTQPFTYLSSTQHICRQQNNQKARLFLRLSRKNNSLVISWELKVHGKLA